MLRCFFFLREASSFLLVCSDVFTKILTWLWPHLLTLSAGVLFACVINKARFSFHFVWMNTDGATKDVWCLLMQLKINKYIFRSFWKRNLINIEVLTNSFWFLTIFLNRCVYLPVFWYFFLLYNIFDHLYMDKDL